MCRLVPRNRLKAQGTGASLEGVGYQCCLPVRSSLLIALRSLEMNDDGVRLEWSPVPVRPGHPNLLDDVFAELDRPRSERILAMLEAEQPGQVILTAPKESDLEIRRGKLDHWRIAGGEIAR